MYSTPVLDLDGAWQELCTYGAGTWYGVLRIANAALFQKSWQEGLVHTIRGVQVTPGTRGSGYTIHTYYQVRKTNRDEHLVLGVQVLQYEYSGVWSSEPFWVNGYWYKYRSTVVTANLVWSNGTPSVRFGIPRSAIAPAGASVPCSHLILLALKVCIQYTVRVPRIPTG
jgi:hypothetical protein